MRKLRLSVDELHVATFETDPAVAGAGTVDAQQTQPDSTFNPCTGVHCTYPIQLCRPRREENAAEQQQQR